MVIPDGMGPMVRRDELPPTKLQIAITVTGSQIHVSHAGMDVVRALGFLQLANDALLQKLKPKVALATTLPAAGGPGGPGGPGGAPAR